MVKRISVVYHLRLDPQKEQAALRAHALHANYCPVARTIRDCVEIQTELVMEPLED